MNRVSISDVVSLVFAVIIACLITFSMIQDIRLISILFIPVFFFGALKASISPKLVFFFLLGGFLILPQTGHYNLLPVISVKLALAFFLIILMHVFVKVRFNNELSKIFLFLSLYVLFEAFMGVIYGYHKLFILNEALKYLYYPASFFFVSSILNNPRTDKKKYIIDIFRFIIIACLITAFLIIYIYIFINSGTRVITRMGNILLCGVIGCLMFILQGKSNATRIWLSICLVIYLVAIIMTMQRSLWIGLVVSVCTFFLIELILHKSKFIYFVRLVLVSGVLLLLVFSFIGTLNIQQSGLENRVESFEEGAKVSSIVIRALFYVKALNDTQEHFIFGRGLGRAFNFEFFTDNLVSHVDNSYITLIWKMGVIGLMIFLTLYFLVIRKLIRIIFQINERVYRLVAISIFSLFAGQFVNALACVVITQYHFNFIWGTLIAIVVALNRMIEVNSNTFSHVDSRSHNEINTIS